MNNEFDIEEYLNLLPDNVDIINVLWQIKYLPDLSRFKNLQYLYCNTNELTSLSVLPENLKILYCFNNNLTSLPVLPKNLKILHCSNNKLTSLPVLPENLKELYCHHNNLSSLPVLPKNLKRLHCYCNDLILLPVLPEKLNVLIYFENPICNIIMYYNDINIINKQIIILNNFRYLYYCLKHRKIFLKIMEPVIKKRYHPSYLYNLNEEDDLDEKLGEW